MNKWFDAFAARLRREAEQRGATIEEPSLDPKVAEELLELARVTAHTQERRFAPLACYVAGVAGERLRRQKPDIGAAGVASYIRQVREDLERQASPA